MRNEGYAAGLKTYLINIIIRDLLDHTHPLTVSRTCEALAEGEVHGLHSFGEYDLVDSACGREGGEGGRRK